VRGGEDERWRPVSRELRQKRILRRRAREEEFVVEAGSRMRRLSIPSRARRVAVGERADQLSRTQLRRRVAVMPGPPIGDLFRIRDRLRAFVARDRLGIARIFVRRGEGEPADGVFDTEQILKLEGDIVGRANDQEIVGNRVRVALARSDVVATVAVASLLAGLVVKRLEQVRAAVFRLASSGSSAARISAAAFS
jgi:hypothetical protein